MKVNDIVVLKNTSGDRNKILELSKHLFRIVAKDKQNLRLESLETGVMIIIAHECVRLATLKERYLREGNVVELENGDTLIVVGNAIINYDYHEPLNNYGDDLENIHSNGFDIKAVYEHINPFYHTRNNCFENMLDTKENSKLLWQRKPKIELTDDEKVILRNLDKKYKYISRAYDNELSIHIKNDINDGFLLRGFEELFKPITEESGIHKIKDLIK